MRISRGKSFRGFHAPRDRFGSRNSGTHLQLRRAKIRSTKINIPEVEIIVSVCAGLDTVDEHSNIIRLVHYTTQEYFQRTQKDGFPDGESDLAAACLRYISFPVFGEERDPEKFVASHPLYSYAPVNWGHHLRPNWEAGKELLGAFQISKKQVATAGNTVLLLSLKGSEKDPNQLGDEQWGSFWSQLTGLHLMVYFGLHEALDFFLDDREIPEKPLNGGRTLLGWAAVYGHEDVARWLISRGAAVQTCDDLDQTPLWLASYFGHTKVVELLLENGANPRSRDERWRDPVMVATMNGHEEVVRAILAKNPLSALSYKRNSCTTTLMHASELFSEGIVRMLLGVPNIKKCFITPNRCGETALTLAVRRQWGSQDDKMAVIRLLLGAGATCQWENRTDLHSGARLSWRINPPLLYAVVRGEEDLVKLLLDHGAPSEGEDEWHCQCLLSSAVEHHRPGSAILEILLAAGAPTEAKNRSGWTPLVYATRLRVASDEGAADAFRLLLQYGANINSKDITRRTPLVNVIFPLHNKLEVLYPEGRREQLRRLVAAGAYLEARDAYGILPLERAVVSGDDELVDILVAGGARTDSPDFKRFGTKVADEIKYILNNYGLNGGFRRLRGG